MSFWSRLFKKEVEEPILVGEHPEIPPINQEDIIVEDSTMSETVKISLFFPQGKTG